jgi:hypothetical protein
MRTALLLIICVFVVGLAQAEEASFLIKIEKFDQTSGEVHFRLIRNSEKSCWVNIEVLTDVAYILSGPGSAYMIVPGWSFVAGEDKTYILLMPHLHDGKQRSQSRLFKVRIDELDKQQGAKWKGGSILLKFQMSGFERKTNEVVSEVVEVELALNK